MKSILITIFSFLFIVSGFGQTRNVVANTNGVVIQPTNIWTANATNARTGLGLGSAATNPASAFQSSSSVLTNLASSNAINLTNIRATNIVGTVALSLGGTGATNAAGARTNLGLGWSALTNSNAATSLLGYTTNGQVVANTGTNLLTFTNSVAFSDTQVTSSGLSWAGVPKVDLEQTSLVDELGVSVLSWVGPTIYMTLPVDFANPDLKNITRTNLGLGWSALTNSNAATSLIGYTTNGGVIANTGTNALRFTNDTVILGGTGDVYFSGDSFYFSGGLRWSPEDNSFSFPLNFVGTNTAAETRTNLGLGWAALTNSNAGTSLVSVNSNGSVVSPTNFWQVAPIQTVVQNFTPVVNATNNATNARTLYVYSLATNVSGVTNIVVLPTNTATFVGDTATVIHRGTTSSTTAVRISGQSTNVITISNYDDAIKLIHENGSWSFYHNIGFVEPIRFIDGDIELNQAVSRTNLGMPLTVLTNTNKTTFQEALFNTNSIPTNSANVNGISFNTAVAWMEINIVTNNVTNSFRIPLFK